jgi:hypothetical protein
VRPETTDTARAIPGTARTRGLCRYSSIQVVFFHGRLPLLDRFTGDRRTLGF